MVLSLFLIPFLVVAQELVPKEENRKWGFVNNVGNVVVPFQYDSAKEFSEGMAAVQLNGKSGFINNAGNVVIPLIFDNIVPFYGSETTWAMLNRKWEVIDRNGNVIQRNSASLELPVKVENNNCKVTIIDFFTDKDVYGNVTLNILCDKIDCSSEDFSFRNAIPRVQIVSNGQQFENKDYVVLAMFENQMIVDNQPVEKKQYFIYRYIFGTSVSPKSLIFDNSDYPNGKISIKIEK